MVGVASLAAARLSVVIGAISQGFGGVYQDRPSFADYSSGIEYGRFRPRHGNAKHRIMTQFKPPPAPSEVEAFIGQVVTDLSAAFSGVLVNVGRKLGLYQAMADSPKQPAFASAMSASGSPTRRPAAMSPTIPRSRLTPCRRRSGWFWCST